MKEMQISEALDFWDLKNKSFYVSCVLSLTIQGEIKLPKTAQTSHI